jgi:hypothetical protein
VIELFRRRRLERVDLAALRVDAGHHVIDDAVLAGRIHALKDHQHGPAILGPQALLQLGKPRRAAGEQLLGLVLVDAIGFRRIAVGDPEFLRPGDADAFDGFDQIHRVEHP